MNPTAIKTELPPATRLHKASFVVFFAGLLCPLLLADEPATEKKPVVSPQLSGGGLEIRHKLEGKKLRELSVLPAGMTNTLPKVQGDPTAGVEVELQVTGQDWSSHAKKLIGGNPGKGLIYLGQQTLESKSGRHEVLLQQAPELGLRVESHYEFFQDVPVMRRWSRVVNEGKAPVGIEHVSSAMVYNFANFGPQQQLDERSAVAVRAAVALGLSGERLLQSHRDHVQQRRQLVHDVAVAHRHGREPRHRRYLVLADRTQRFVALGNFRNRQPHELSLSRRAGRTFQRGVEKPPTRSELRFRPGSRGLREGRLQ
ncbi:MAG: hypothetical protein NTZ16_09745 [Verrucomicrobia bacterium]|nr:hypothetical protein [Verrucomicrobiota bacterium]